MAFALALTSLAGVAALVASAREARLAYAVAKAVAAVGFVWLALSAGAPTSLASRLIVAGLVLSGIGDVALAFRGRAAFLGGMAAFGLAHLAYSTAFVAHGLALAWTLVAAALAGVAGEVVWRRLRSHLPAQLVVPIAAYVVLVTAMVALAWGAVGGGIAIATGVGATAFYLSDLAVARERFVTHDIAEKRWGLPLYYVGQVLIALAAR